MPKKKKPVSVEFEVDGRKVSPDKFAGAVMAPIVELKETIESRDGLEYTGMLELSPGNRDEVRCRLLSYQLGEEAWRVRVAMEGVVDAHLDRSDLEAARELVHDYYVKRVAIEIMTGTLAPGASGVFFYLDGDDRRPDELNIHCRGGKFPPED